MCSSNELLNPLAKYSEGKGDLAPSDSTRDLYAPNFFASWIGMLPGTVLFVYIGSLAGSLANLGAKSDRTRTPAEWALYGVGLLATVAVTVYVTRLAKRALAQRISAK